MAIIAVVLIAAAVISVAMTYWFTRDSLARYYSTSAKLAGRGISTDLVQVDSGGPFQPAAMVEEDVKVVVEGPGATTVGGTAEYKCTVDGSAFEADWSVEPEDAGAINPKKGSTVKFSAAISGVAKLTATAGMGKTATIEVAVASAAPSVRLPFLGKGYGGIAVGLVAVFALLGLGLAGRIGSDALGTLFGGLLGIGAARVIGGGTGGGGDDDTKAP